jgi:phage FluMu protein Com
MQIRCFNCHKPFALGKDTLHAALDIMAEENLSHYNAHCPHCGKVNRVAHHDMLKAAPEWSKQKADVPANE